MAVEGERRASALSDGAPSCRLYEYVRCAAVDACNPLQWRCDQWALFAVSI
ncbi:hypothetical protein XCR_3491 [Xanthomonas campestris pv. raphani 756C]|nr:hypothetical protein XCR_3491 [Xanthomonas campestris pv. raphani 756C]